MELVRLPDPCSLLSLEAALRKGVHVLHFVGHGEYRKKEGKAVLFLADENNRVAEVDDAAIGGMLARQLMDAAMAPDDKLRLILYRAARPRSAARPTLSAGLRRGWWRAASRR